jgi:MaoC like domain
MSTWSIVARNLPEHATNPIHTDEGAQAAGFERALVAGVTSYAYALHPVLERFGLPWLEHGEAEVRFRSPVFDGDTVLFPVLERDDGGVSVSAVVGRMIRPLVEVEAWPAHRPGPHPGLEPRSGEQLKTVIVPLVGEYGSEYAARAGDSLALCREEGVVHPAVWAALANYVYHRQVARGSWIHTRSIVRNFAAAPEGADASVETTVFRRFHRSGERAVSDVVIRVDGLVVAAIEHEAIVDLAST